MANLPRINISDITDKAKHSILSIDVDTIKVSAQKAGTVISEKALDIKERTIETKDNLEAKYTELDRLLDRSITEYNDVFTLMNDKGVRLFVERCRAVDSIAFVENLVNSIANKPKSFDVDCKEIDTHRDKFIDSCEFAESELKAARIAIIRAGAGLMSGASVAFMSPTSAMWTASTFGTVPVGSAISALSSSATSTAAAAWIGGGVITTGGHMAAGNAFLALAGPVGWTIAGATLLSTILLFSSKKIKLNKQKNEEIDAVKKNIERIKELDANLLLLLDQTKIIREELSKSYIDCVVLHSKEYLVLSDEEKIKLGSLVNIAKSLSVMLEKTLQ